MNTKQVDTTKNMLAALLTVAHHAVDLAAASQPPTKYDAEPKPEPIEPQSLTFGFYVETLIKSLSKVLIVTAVEAVIVALFITQGVGVAAVLLAVAALAGLWVVERVARKRLTTTERATTVTSN